MEGKSLGSNDGISLRAPTSSSGALPPIAFSAEDSVNCVPAGSIVGKALGAYDDNLLIHTDTTSS